MKLESNGNLPLPKSGANIFAICSYITCIYVENRSRAHNQLSIVEAQGTFHNTLEHKLEIENAVETNIMNTSQYKSAAEQKQKGVQLMHCTTV